MHFLLMAALIVFAPLSPATTAQPRPAVHAATAVLAAEPSVAPTAPATPLPRRQATERPWWPYAIMTVLLIALVGIGIALLTGRNAARKQNRA